ncbi:uncharacterized protein LOC121731798 [Aricia agestis]|uniref:uncharacterized protein LOC121731798 n=1 Tax=Aricia agestis TaxID=91739 RepID=UPI001C205FBA|nr:uncharacterized protein LOC121731798 [Aricia agestis]
MVNYKRVVCEVALLLLLTAAASAAPAPDCTERHYDQRQNGSENYRLNIDGVVIAVAPAESLLAAASDFDISDLLELEDFENFQKPKPPAEPSKPEKPEESKPDDFKPEENKPVELSSAESKPSNLKSQRKEASLRKQEKAQRLKQRLASVLIPLLRKNRHH